MYEVNRILPGNNIETLKIIPDNSVNCCVTSPPYFSMRDYGIENQIGLEDTPEQYIQNLVDIFREVKRILKDDGTLWVNIGDSYAGGAKKWTHPVIKSKDLIGLPWLLAFALRADGWYLRQDIIWAKPSPMPESIKDRFCKSHEYIFLFSKNKKYYFDQQHALEDSIHYQRQNTAIRKRGYNRMPKEYNKWPQNHGNSIETTAQRTMRDVWFVATEISKVEHYAMFPEKLILPCILCGCPVNGIVLDPFMGSGSTAVVAMKNFRRYIGCEINPEYIKIAESRIANERGLWDE